MNIRNLFAERIGGTAFGNSTEIYKFEKIKRAKALAAKNHPGTELLDFGVGEPDQVAPEPIRNSLKLAVDKRENRGYADNGIKEFRIAACDYMRGFFGVEGLDPDDNVNHSIGSKSALAAIPLCFINPGDTAITTVPGYPVLATHTRYLGGRVLALPLRPENGFYPDLNAIRRQDAEQAKLIYVNYPNNPTGAPPSEEFFDRLIEFAERFDVLIVHDAAYATLVYGRKPLSILSRPGGMDTAVELHSMSKSYNMTGWRLGFVAGNSPAIRAYAEVKDNSDSGQFKAIQAAACAGIADRTISERIRDHYETRLKKLVAALNDAGCAARMPGGTFYLYVPAPKSAGSTVFNSAAEASEYLIVNLLVSTVPWDDAGGFLRFSATFESQGDLDDDHVIAELSRRLESADLKWN